MAALINSSSFTDGSNALKYCISRPDCLAPREEAVELLIEQKFGAIPVVDAAEGLVGIVSYVDVLRCFLNRLREERL